MYKELVTDVFFDLDHTLWDFEKNSALTFEKIFKENELEVNLERFLKIYTPINLAYWKLYREEKISKPELRYARLRNTFDQLSITVEDELISTLSVQYIEHLSTFNYLVPNTLSILDYLYPKYRLHIITNGFQEVQQKKLENASIAAYFEHVIDSETAGVKKPNPYIFTYSLEKAAVAPEKAIMIGDNLEADVLGARAVGLHTLHFNVHKDPSHQHGEIIDDLIEIKAYL
ncbi:YjjG family noncanonical pyrimidine nucleotidase [Lentiprolixibacter aurantiacus]|uniref:YjjG family noncanonical pyrimidine nucleotidase n=1 Tax=Lentiprolixibacter aurantiacus TaxID=2993939 RepID=A0AAE3MMY2_9FLAO|nr:YjjG family noncanonical pyrimidine nucleotidase [Lentiprolixibacter aurantiacus]MCX2720701.1 YjjG family noncanonical pyrimidine nucleotidase [Lentiprolixibacter aurantiacus]